MIFSDSMIRKKYRTLLQVLAICVLCIIIVRVWMSRQNKQRRKDNMFEIDLYDDGDYDEKERLKFLLANGRAGGLAQSRLALGHPVNPGLKKALRRPTPARPQIIIQDNPQIVMTDKMSDLDIENNFFRYLEAKDVICKDDKRVGYQHDGGYNVCFSPPLGFKKPCVVFSFGIGDNWLFDDATSKIYGCKVYAFDPSLNTPDHNRSVLIKFQRIGLGRKTEINKRGWPMKTLGKHFKDEGYYKSKIDYLKFDIEYNEWAVFHSIFQEGSLKNVRQLGFEVHLNEFFKTQKLNFRTSKEDFLYMYQTLEMLRKLNFRKFNYRLNPFGEYKSTISGKVRSFSYELHYMNMNYIPSNYTLQSSQTIKGT